MKKILLRYLPIFLVILLLLVRTIETKGKTNKRTNEVSQEELLKKQKESIRVLESELDKLAVNFEYYQNTSGLLLKQTNWINEKVVPYYEDIERFKNITDMTKHLSMLDMTKPSSKQDITKPLSKLDILKKVSKVSPVGEFSETISEIIINLEKLHEFLELNKKINNSINKINNLREKYEKTNDIEVLQDINKELTTKYIYLIRDLEKLTNESIDTFDTCATLIYQKQNIKMIASDAIDKVKIWDNSKKETSEEEIILEKLEENKKNIEKAPKEIQNKMKLDYEYILKIQSETEVISVFNEILTKN
ncbi:hypothetical protein [Neobacillus drentensis]|uniref:hypothetical protein n=1 Tax=Neobacillus drentensis TaxID=220684 RepID=UPI0030001EEA